MLSRKVAHSTNHAWVNTYQLNTAWVTVTQYLSFHYSDRFIVANHYRKVIRDGPRIFRLGGCQPLLGGRQPPTRLFLTKMDVKALSGWAWHRKL